jgi:hypothetical protein
MDDLRYILLALAIGAAALCAGGESRAAQLCAYRDYMPDYAAFLARTKTQSSSARAADFVTHYASVHTDFYRTELFGDTAKQKIRAVRYFDPAKRMRFAGLPALTDARVLALADTLGAQFAAQQKRFAAAFPDFHCDAQVEFAPSLMLFDGHPDTFEGKNYLFFGGDMIAMVHGPADMPAFFDHEIFHLYHRRVLGSAAPEGDKPAWWSMWVEGLATYVSQRMNPALDAQHVLWFPTDIVARMGNEGARGARLLRADMEKTGPEADRWFSAGQSVAGLPQRAGYYYGYLFAKSVGTHRLLAELARLKPADVHRQEIKFLNSLAAN